MQRHALAAHLHQVLLAEQHRAAAGPLGELDQLQQGALAGAGMAGDEQHFTGRDREADVAERDVAAGVLLADIVETQDRHGEAPRLASRDAAVSPERWAAASAVILLPSAPAARRCAKGG